MQLPPSFLLSIGLKLSDTIFIGFFMQPASVSYKRRLADDNYQFPLQPVVPECSEPAPEAKKQRHTDESAEIQHQLFCQNVQDGVVRCPPDLDNDLQERNKLIGLFSAHCNDVAKNLIIQIDFWTNLASFVQDEPKKMWFDNFLSCRSNLEYKAVLNHLISCVLEQQCMRELITQNPSNKEYYEAGIGIFLTDVIERELSWMKLNASAILNGLVLVEKTITLFEMVEPHQALWTNLPRDFLVALRELLKQDDAASRDRFLQELCKTNHPPIIIDTMAFIFRMPFGEQEPMVNFLALAFFAASQQARPLPQITTGDDPMEI